MNKVMIIDHYDSFVYNLAHMVSVLGAQVVVISCDDCTPDQLNSYQPTHLIFSPGPCGPKETGLSAAVMRAWLGRIPILGVCLGSLVLYHICGGAIVPATQPRHGKQIALCHAGQGLFAGVDSPAVVGLYHALMMAPEVPEALRVLLYCPQQQIMAIQHRQAHAYGLQFHPESILTPQGLQLLRNFLALKEAGANV
jgi:anthranilate synthase/aminodeoxychorismate synthase-like glutamine amidotransferase